GGDQRALGYRLDEQARAVAVDPAKVYRVHWAPAFGAYQRKRGRVSELKKILAEPEDNLPIVEQAISLLSPDDQEAFTEALWSSQFSSSQQLVALETDGAMRDTVK